MLKHMFLKLKKFDMHMYKLNMSKLVVEPEKAEKGEPKKPLAQSSKYNNGNTWINSLYYTENF